MLPGGWFKMNGQRKWSWVLRNFLSGATQAWPIWGQGYSTSNLYLTLQRIASNAATNVVLIQWPNGTLSPSRLPFNDDPRGRVIFVFNQVSSMNTSFSGSKLAWPAIHSRRFSFTSGRSCSAAFSTFLIVSFNAFNARQSVLLEIPIFKWSRRLSRVRSGFSSTASRIVSECLGHLVCWLRVVTGAILHSFSNEKSHSGKNGIQVIPLFTLICLPAVFV